MFLQIFGKNQLWVVKSSVNQHNQKQPQYDGNVKLTTKTLVLLALSKPLDRC